MKRWLCALLGLLPACAPSPDKPMIIAHRGASVEHVENTLPAFRRALELEVDGIELDIHLSQDGRLLVHHDDTLKRLLKDPRAIASFDFATLRGLGDIDALPELDDVLQLTAGKTHLFLEIKTATAALATAELANRYVADGRMRPEQFTIISFDLPSLRALRTAFPTLRLGATFGRLPPNWQGQVADIRPQTINLGIRDANALATSAIRQAGHEIYLWTVNTPRQLRKARRLRPTGIMGDDPAWLQSHW